MTITTDMIQPIATSISENMKVILPVAFSIFGGLVSAKMIPSFIYKFI